MHNSAPRAAPISHPSVQAYTGDDLFEYASHNTIALTPRDGSATAPEWQFAYPLGGMQYLATAYDTNGGVMATAQCAVVKGRNAPPAQTAPLRLFLYSGVPFALAIGRSGWVTDDYTSEGDLAAALTGVWTARAPPRSHAGGRGAPPRVLV